MLAGAGAADGVGAGDHAGVQFGDPPLLVAVVGIDEDAEMEIAVADMTTQRRDQFQLRDILPGPRNDTGKFGNRHADIRRNTLRSRAQRERRPPDIMTRLPEFRAVFRRRRPAKLAPAELARDLGRQPDLFVDRLVRAMELQKQRRLDGKVKLRVAVAGLNLERIQQLRTRQWNRTLDRGDDRGHGCLHGREGADRRTDAFGNRRQPQRHFGDDTERPLGADEQPGQIVAGGRLPRASPGLDQLAVRQHDPQRHHEIAHRAVTHRIGAGRARRGHPADRGIRARINRKEQTGVPQCRIQGLAGDARFHGAIEIGLRHPQDAVHAGQIDGDAALLGADLPLGGRACAEGDDGAALPVADRKRIDHILCRGGREHRVGHRCRMGCHAGRVVPANGSRRRKPVAEPRAQLSDGVDRSACHPALPICRARASGATAAGIPR